MVTHPSVKRSLVVLGGVFLLAVAAGYVDSCRDASEPWFVETESEGPHDGGRPPERAVGAPPSDGSAAPPKDERGRIEAASIHETYHPRAAGEWQGMRVEISELAPCLSSDRCGMGLACVEARCGPCVRDSDCAAGEGCSMDHCVPLDGLACRSARECPADHLCALTGTSDGPRGNREMRAYCLPLSGGYEFAEVQERPAIPDPRGLEDFGPGARMDREVVERARTRPLGGTP